MARYFYVPNNTPIKEMALDVNLESDTVKIITCNGWTMGESIDNMSTTQVIIFGLYKTNDNFIIIIFISNRFYQPNV